MARPAIRLRLVTAAANSFAAMAYPLLVSLFTASASAHSGRII
jgi:hypothetical protein